jgi:hypothetical protein
MRSKERQEAALETWGAKVAGAALDVPTVIGIPDHFTLVIRIAPAKAALRGTMESEDIGV